MAARYLRFVQALALVGAAPACARSPQPTATTTSPSETPPAKASVQENDLCKPPPYDPGPASSGGLPGPNAPGCPPDTPKDGSPCDSTKLEKCFCNYGGSCFDQCTCTKGAWSCGRICSGPLPPPDLPSLDLSALDERPLPQKDLGRPRNEGVLQGRNSNFTSS